MSNDVPPQAPGSPEPDPFDELLRGLVNQPDAAQPGGDLPPTEAMPTPGAPPGGFPPAAQEDVPTVAFTPPQHPEPSSLIQPTPPTTLYPAAPVEQPTEVLGGLGGFPPTAPTDAWSLGSAGVADAGGTGSGRRKALLGILIAIAAILVVAIAILLTILAIGPHGATPVASHSSSPSATPSSTPSTTPSPTPTPTMSPAAITSFTAKANTVACPYDKSGTQQVLLSWSVTDATQIAVASAAAQVDATKQPYQNNLGPTVTDFAIPYVCSNAKWAYTLTAIGADGQPQSAVITITASYAAPPAPSPTPSPSISAFGPSAPTINCTASPNSWTVSWTIANLQSSDVVNFGIGNAGAFNSSSLPANGTLTAGTGSGNFPNPCSSHLASQTYYLTVLRGGNQVAQQSFAESFTY